MERNAHVQPLMASLLNSFSPAVPQPTRDEMRVAYIAQLRSMDWSFEWSDDHAAYLRGRDSLAQLRAAQPKLDPDALLWNAAAPAEYQIRRAA